MESEGRCQQSKIFTSDRKHYGAWHVWVNQCWLWILAGGYFVLTLFLELSVQKFTLVTVLLTLLSARRETITSSNSWKYLLLGALNCLCVELIWKPSILIGFDITHLAPSWFNSSQVTTVCLLFFFFFPFLPVLPNLLHRAEIYTSVSPPYICW